MIVLRTFACQLAAIKVNIVHGTVFDNCFSVRCGDENIKTTFGSKMKKQGENHELITSSGAFINSLSHLLPLK